MATRNDWFRDAEERQEHINMVRDQRKWPWGDELPMKHPERLSSRGSMFASDKTHGVITEEGVPVIHFEDGTTEVYSSVEEMVDHGWVVD